MPRKRKMSVKIGEFDKKLDFIIQTFQTKFSRQSESLTTLHSKVNYMLAFASLLIAGYLTVLLDNKLDLSCNPTYKIFVILGLIGLLCCVVLLLVAARNRRFYDPPDSETLYSKKSFKMSLFDLKNQVASDMKDSFEKNVMQLENIAVWLNYAMLVFVGSLFIVVISALLLPGCVRISNMPKDNASTTSQQPSPVPPSQSPGTVVNKGPFTPTQQPNTPMPVPPSQTSGTALPFSEQSVTPKSDR